MSVLIVQIINSFILLLLQGGRILTPDFIGVIFLPFNSSYKFDSGSIIMYNKLL